MYLRGTCTLERTDAMLGLFSDILSGVDLANRERFGQMVLETQARLQSSLLPSGSSYVATRLASGDGESGWLAEKTGGLDYLLFIRSLTAGMAEGWPGIEERLREIHARVVGSPGAICNVTTEGTIWPKIRSRVRDFLDALPGLPVEREEWKIAAPVADEAFTVPSQVNFVGRGSNIFRGGYELHGSIFAALTHLRTTWIWERVRVHGGAYGGMVRFNPLHGGLSFLSYRDPNILETLGVYDGSAGFLREAGLSEEELVRIIIGAVGDMDAPLLPDAQGFLSLRRHLTGIEDARRQRLRDELLGAGRDACDALAEALDGMPSPRTVVIGSSEKVEDARAGLAPGLRVSPLL